MTTAIDLEAALSRLTEPWSPVTVATLNDYDVRVVRLNGEFTWHSHPGTDELFLVLAGSMVISVEGTDDVLLEKGQLYVVPRGVRHRPSSVEGAQVLLIEPSGEPNTGDSPSHLTSERRVL